VSHTYDTRLQHVDAAATASAPVAAAANCGSSHAQKRGSHVRTHTDLLVDLALLAVSFFDLALHHVPDTQRRAVAFRSCASGSRGQVGQGEVCDSQTPVRAHTSAYVSCHHQSDNSQHTLVATQSHLASKPQPQP
jgi:hypothetical protein